MGCMFTQAIPCCSHAPPTAGTTGWLLLPQAMAAALSTCTACGPRQRSCTATGRRQDLPLPLLLLPMPPPPPLLLLSILVAPEPRTPCPLLQWVLLKGGHLPEQEQEQQEEAERVVTDILFDGKNMIELREPYIR